MKKTNVLILFTDQQRWDTVNAAGYDYMITPNLDRLAKDGCIYTNAHSSNPVCMPARHDLITGLTARAHGYFGNSKNPIKDYSLPTLPRIFSENDYRTAAIGKMHFLPARMHHGFSEMYLMEELPEHRQDDQYATYLKNEGLGDVQNLHGVRPHIYHIPQNAQTDEAHHGSTWVTNKTLEWLEENNDNPFFLMVGWIQPHPPWNIPKELDGIYKDKNIPKAVPISRDYPDIKEMSEWFGDFDTDEEKRKIREAYYSAVTLVDKNVGRILDYLEKKGILDDTLIIYTSDHGEMLQDKGYYSKEVPYNGAVRIPMIVRYPEKFDKGIKKDELVDTLDIMPTCLDVCNLEYNGEKYELPGDSLCSQNPKRDRNYICSATAALSPRRWVMCRSDRYKYVYNYNKGTEELYDLKEDAGETLNLIKNGNYSVDVYNDLKKHAIEYEKELGPEGAIVDDNFVVVDSNEFHGSVRGKWHYWCISQMQAFYEGSNKEKGERLIYEMEQALSNYEKSGKNLNNVFNDKTWIAAFEERFKKYGECEGYKEKIFTIKDDNSNI